MDHEGLARSMSASRSAVQVVGSFLQLRSRSAAESSGGTCSRSSPPSRRSRWNAMGQMLSISRTTSIGLIICIGWPAGDARSRAWMQTPAGCPKHPFSRRAAAQRYPISLLCHSFPAAIILTASAHSYLCSPISLRSTAHHGIALVMPLCVYCWTCSVHWKH